MNNKYMSKLSSILQCVYLLVLTMHFEWYVQSICAYHLRVRTTNSDFMFPIWLVEIEVLKLKGRSRRQWREGEKSTIVTIVLVPVTSHYSSDSPYTYVSTSLYSIFIWYIYIEGERESEHDYVCYLGAGEFGVGTWKAFFLNTYSFIFVKWRGMKL